MGEYGTHGPSPPAARQRVFEAVSRMAEVTGYLPKAPQNHRRGAKAFSTWRKYYKSRGRSRPTIPAVFRKTQRFCYPVAAQKRSRKAWGSGTPRCGGRGCATPSGAGAEGSDASHDGRLAVLYGGRGQPLRVSEVAKKLGVCNATAYRLCESGALPHVRVVNSIRVRPRDLAEYLAGARSLGIAEFVDPRSHRSSPS